MCFTGNQRSSNIAEGEAAPQQPATQYDTVKWWSENIGREGERERENKSQKDLEGRKRKLKQKQKSIYHFLSFSFPFPFPLSLSCSLFILKLILDSLGKQPAGSKEETLILRLSEVQTCQSQSKCLEARVIWFACFLQFQYNKSLFVILASLKIFKSSFKISDCFKVNLNRITVSCLSPLVSYSPYIIYLFLQLSLPVFRSGPLRKSRVDRYVVTCKKNNPFPKI